MVLAGRGSALIPPARPGCGKALDVTAWSSAARRPRHAARRRRVARSPRSGTVRVNRAPVLTLWAAVVAERLGHDRATALTLGKALAGLSAVAKGTRLGLHAETSEAERTARPRAREGRSDLGRAHGPAPSCGTTPGRDCARSGSHARGPCGGRALSRGQARRRPSRGARLDDRAREVHPQGASCPGGPLRCTRSSVRASPRASADGAPRASSTSHACGHWRGSGRQHARGRRSPRAERSLVTRFDQSTPPSQSPGIGSNTAMNGTERGPNSPSPELTSPSPKSTRPA